MTVVAVCSTRSSPGVTTLCVALCAAWAHRGLRPLLIEADPAGGVIGLRFAMSADPSLRTLWADMRRGYSPDLVQQNSRELRGIDCLLAPTDPLLAARALDHVAPVLAREIGGLDRPVIVDLGRISDTSQALPFVGSATHVLVVSRPRVEDTQSLLYGSRLLEAAGRRPSIVSIGDGPHHPADMAALAGLPLAAVLPDDRAVASAFSGGRFVARKLPKTTLWRCIDALAGQLTAGTLAPSPAHHAVVPVPSAPSPLPPEPTRMPPGERYVDRSIPSVADLSAAIDPRAAMESRTWTDPVIEDDPDATIPRRDRSALSNAGAR